MSRALKRAECWSDHRLVNGIMSLRLALETTNNSKPTRHHQQRKEQCTDLILALK